MAGPKSNKRKRNAQSNNQSNKNPKHTATSLPSPPSSDTNEPKSLSTIISEEEIEITVDTLATLSKHPTLIKSKPCKSLRTAVFDFRQACTTGANTTGEAMNLTARVSAAIADGKYTDALVVLAEMRVRGEAPKLGALCRWVRELDVISGVSLGEGGGSEGANAEARGRGDNAERIRVVDAILRVTGPRDLNFSAGDLGMERAIVQKEIWDLHDPVTPRLPVRESVLDGSIYNGPSTKDSYKSLFHILETTPGPQRKPPNAHDAVLYLTSNNAIPLSPIPPQTTAHAHPHVPHLSLIRNVLHPSECTSLVSACEAIGFLPDAPLADDGPDASILAHNVYWLIDTALHDALWSRVSPFVPSSMGGRKVRGLNRRFRVYRYVPGASYRAHIDGAWPPSSTTPVPGTPSGLKYIYDSSPQDRKQSSLFTFLIYLNDEFEGGETTFFLPSVREGVLNAYPVKPVIGSVALFPHGEMGDRQGPLLHEGTGGRRGAKYVVRTEVEYDVEAGLE